MKPRWLPFLLPLLALSPAFGFMDRPNVVILLADDLGYRDIGCYDGPVQTPALDELAASGIRFPVFYAGAPVCSPSRAVILTGRHHIRTGVWSWIHNATQASHLLEREVTLAEILREAGYATGHFGKWHLGLPTDTHDKPTPAAHGFDYWFATENNAHPSHQNPNNFIRNGQAVGPLEGYSSQLVVDEALHWLEAIRTPGQPFFLNVWFHEPHRPLGAPDGLVRKYGGSEDAGARYSATIDNTDKAIARLLEGLRRADHPRNTLIIYTSDNGSYRAERTGDLRGQKGLNWEGGIRVPGIVSWPGRIAEGRTGSVPAGHVDLLPTICSLLQLPEPDVHLDGADLSAYLTGEAETVVRGQPFFWHLQRSRPIVAMRAGRYSLVADPDYPLSEHNRFLEEWIPAIRAGAYTNWRLYDLEVDPGQEKDISAENQELLEQLKAKLMEINKGIMAESTDWQAAPDAD